MTRAESNAARYEREHTDYMRRREARLAYAKQYAKDHREHIAEMQRERRRKEREGIVDKPKYRPPSTTLLESLLPPMLYAQRSRLRDQYWAIHISQRPPYDYYLRCKTIEYLRDKNYERRE